MAKYDPEKKFKANDKLLGELAELDAQFLLGNVGKYVYQAKRKLLKQRYIKINS